MSRTSTGIALLLVCLAATARADEPYPTLPAPSPAAYSLPGPAPVCRACQPVNLWGHKWERFVRWHRQRNCETYYPYCLPVTDPQHGHFETRWRPYEAVYAAPPEAAVPSEPAVPPVDTIEPSSHSTPGVASLTRQEDVPPVRRPTPSRFDPDFEIPARAEDDFGGIPDAVDAIGDFGFE